MSGVPPAGRPTMRCTGRGGESSAMATRARSPAAAAPAPASRIIRRREIIMTFPKSLGLDVGELDHLAPFGDFIGGELAELGGRARNHRAAEVDDLRFDTGVGQSAVDLAIESLDDVRWRVLWRGDANPLARFKSRHEVGHPRDVRRSFGPRG